MDMKIKCPVHSQDESDERFISAGAVLECETWILIYDKINQFST